MSKLVIRHDLHQLSEAEAKQYLRDVSEFLEVDPDLNAFDLIWMPNPSGEGKTLCVYARRGTCELLRAKHEITVDDQTEGVVEGSYVVRVKGHDRTGRKEIALGSRSIQDLKGRDRDDAIMTASTRALQRLTMQFTGLGILSESEVTSLANQAVAAPNPSAGATLAGSPIVIAPNPSVPVNNAPGKPVQPTESFPVSQDPATQAQVATIIAMREIDNAKAARAVADAATQADIPKAEQAVTPVESTTSAEPNPAPDADKKTRKPRAKKNTVALNGVDPEPERVSAPAEPVLCPDCKKPLKDHKLINSVATCDDPAKIEAAKKAGHTEACGYGINCPGHPSAAMRDIPTTSPSVPPQVQPEPPVQAVPAADLPTAEQMANYRTIVATYTKELPPSKDGTYGCTQRMRAFITKWNKGTVPQQMNVKQWNEQIAWFQQFVERNGIKGLVTYIGDFLGDNK